MSEDRREKTPAGGEGLWRGLEEPAGEPDGLSRRQVLGGSLLGLCGLAAGCNWLPQETRDMAPLTRDQPELVPGRPLVFATGVSRNGHAVGVLVRSSMGHPIKVEGNPAHPSSLGATDIFCQVEIDRLYDPDRSQGVRRGGHVSTWADLSAALGPALDRLRGRRGAGLAILTGEITSPLLGRQLTALLAALPGARWYRHEPVGREQAEAGARIAYGEPLRAVYRLDGADVIVALDSDFLFDTPGRLAYARQLADRRRLWDQDPRPGSMNRLYVVEPFPSITGQNADHRLRLRRSEVAAFAVALGRELGAANPAGAGGAPAADPPGGQAGRWLAALAGDLRQRAGRSAIIVGEAQPPAVHALGHAINEHLGNLGQTVLLQPPGETPHGDLAAITAELRAGHVEMLLVLGSNPGYTAPADLRFAEAVAHARVAVHHGLYADETAALCGWHVGALHELESWSDLRGHDGTAGLLQPLIAPLYQGRSAHELLGLVAGDPLRTDLERLRESWKGLDEASWRRALERGVIDGTAAPERRAKVRRAEVEAALGRLAGPERAAAPGGGSLELVFTPDVTVWDGRYANVGRLQELAKPVSQITWDNAICVSPGTATRLGLKSEALVALAVAERTITGPLLVQPGQADDSVVVSLGYGRPRAGRHGDGLGLDAYTLRRAAALWVEPGARLRQASGTHRLARTQYHQRTEGRDMVLEGLRVKEELRPARGAPGVVPRYSLYPEVAYTGRQWGMVIDLTTCIGCNACNVACQEENNIAVVGRKETLNMREMYWIRIDRYYKGDAADPEILTQPVPCMHCEKAPCEVVCPTGATQHSADGLNEMTYNRCVGTRYCSNNCPYKVRRFNFYHYHDATTPVLKLARNPEVTVRSRGVIEKCTYCVQRIRNAEIQAAVTGQPIAEGSLQTACQQVCPTHAIVFGDLSRKDSQVSRLRALPRRYDLMADLNTRPRTSYLTRLRNKNPALG
jgi:molybdopterin-containing oxidoreductase family iron-sulfur binding subunit